MTQATQKSPWGKTIGSRLQWLRTFKGLTLRAFADRLHCSASYLSKLESGKSQAPSERLIVAVSMAYKVSGDWIRSGKGDPFYLPQLTGNAQPDWSNEEMQRIMAVLSELPDALNGVKVVDCILGKIPLAALQEIWRRVRMLPNLTPAAISFWNDVFTDCQFSRLSFSGESSGASNIDKLDNELPAAKVSDVTSEVPTWPGLKAELLKLTVERGMKAWLADELGVSRQVVNNWLATSDQGRPDAENTLLLLRWAKGGGGKIKIPRK